ncbi:hypothetical protein [Kordiimonas gwangyangensis]|uniref:hypothetical protein n=1 Tax=Kordiimonas gwangyangensis TaxID=288022 RepID=UPI0012DF3993|nr:hypothetical protein [Kordiimonas gwangyangensis]
MGKASAFDMNALDSRIRELVAYARERDGEDRTTLFRNLVDLFLTGKAPMREPTRGQLLDVIEALLPHVESESRRTVAELLAGQSNPPMDLVLRICRDRASLVEALLINAPFDEDEVIDLIRETGREHHQIIASRSDLSANVWIALARAAPAAPPFDSRSTLALWRDDLGFQKEGAPQPSATVTALHPEKTASLRILRTDEDLIAERVSGNNRLNDTRMVEAANDQPVVSEPLVATETPEAPEPPHAAPSPAQAGSGDGDNDLIPSAEEDAPLRDPGPGGWSWRSDRDGFITGISPYGCKLLGSVDAALGMGMLDLLGLNTKLGHPVTRAFQRRSTIHDAPIHLPDLGKTHQHWTLEAEPHFSVGGVFEGYEGVLTPVIATAGSVHTAMEDEDPLFLDDPEPAPRRERAARTAPSAEIQKNVLDRSRDEKIAAPASQPVDTKPTPAPTPRTSPISNALGSMAAAVVREAVAETLKTPLTPREEKARYAGDEEDTATEAPQAPAAPAAPSQHLTGAPEEVRAALDMLEQALTRLGEAAKSGQSMQVRLQSEIAMACARALRDQLGDD